MGWGSEPHEGVAEQRRDNGDWTAGVWRSGWGAPVAQRAACSCGWRGDTTHPVPASPGPDSSHWPAYEAARERIDELIHTQWRGEHYAPILGYDPTQLLVLGRDEGGARHFLNGRPVHAGSLLELLLAGGHWQPVTYEWSWQPEQPPTATLTLAAPPAAEGLGEHPTATFALPSTAILRWPAR